MKKLSVLNGSVLLLACAVLLLAGAALKAGGVLPNTAAALQATTGNTFALVPTDDPNVFGHPVDGVAQVSLLGNCHFHGESEVHLPTSPGQPIVITSTSPWTLTASDGVNSLRFNAQGTAT